MPTYEASTSINADPDSVWRALSDVAKWPEWLPTVLKVEPLDGERLSVGSRFVVHQPKLRPATWVVTELAETGRFVWVARSPGLVMLAEHDIAQHSSTASRVTLRFSFNGLLGGVMGRMFRSMTESYLAQEAASLKQRVEIS
ncbi:MAG: SRPBCC family protein [Betaproteobacteria bacterium]|nr:SRPBCC family protein [Betaproteobacteria bacterium]